MKKLSFSIVFTATSLFLWNSCQSENASEAAMPKLYFDLKAYFANQIKQIEATKTSLVKTVFLNGKQETKQLNNLNWQDEFALFINSDINRIAWRDSYSIDSCSMQNNKTHLDYKAVDPDLRTQEIHIWLDTNTRQLDSLTIRNKVENVFYTLDENLYFAPQKSYRINAIQKARFVKLNTMQINGEMAKK